MCDALVHIVSVNIKWFCTMLVSHQFTLSWKLEECFVHHWILFFSNLVSLVIFHGTYLFCQSPNLLLKYGHPYPNFSHVTSWFLYFFSIIQPLKLACIFVRDKLSLLPFYVQKCCQGNNYVMSNSESLQCNFFIFDHVTFT